MSHILTEEEVKRIAPMFLASVEMYAELRKIVPSCFTFSSYDPNRITVIYLTDERIAAIQRVLAKAEGKAE